MNHTRVHKPGQARILAGTASAVPASTVPRKGLALRLPTAAITAIALTTFAAPAGFAVAGPLPDPTPRHGSTAAVAEGDEGLTAALVELREVYSAAPWPGRRAIHNEIVLLLDTGDAAL
jgi:hypothetical protein